MLSNHADLVQLGQVYIPFGVSRNSNKSVRLFNSIPPFAMPFAILFDSSPSSLGLAARRLLESLPINRQSQLQQPSRGKTARTRVQTILAAIVTGAHRRGSEISRSKKNAAARLLYLIQSCSILRFCSNFMLAVLPVFQKFVADFCPNPPANPNWVLSYVYTRVMIQCDGTIQQGAEPITTIGLTLCDLEAV